MKYRKLLWLALPVVALTALWSGRQPLTAVGVREYLQSKGVPARLKITQIGARRVVIEDLALGKAGHAAAARVTVDYALGFAPRVVRISVEGARVAAAIKADGSIDLGDLQALIPPPSDEPLSLPTYDLRLSDAQLQLATPAGPLTLTINGDGSPATAFRATAAGDAARLRYAGAGADTVHLHADATLRGKRLLIAAHATAAGLHAPGDARVQRPTIAFLGAMPLEGDSIAGAWAVRAAAVRVPGGQAEGLRAKGLATLAPAASAAWVRVQASAAQVRPGDASARQLRSLWSGLPASPLDALKPAFSRTLDTIASGTDLQADAALAWRGDTGVLTLSALRLGALASVDSRNLRVALPSLHATGNAEFRLTPVGLSTLEGQVTGINYRPDGPLTGALTLNPVRWRAKDLDLALDRTAISLSPQGTQAASGLTTSLRYNGSRIETLHAPLTFALDPDGTMHLPKGCQAVSIARLQAQSLDLGPVKVGLCAVGGPLLTVKPNGAVQGRAAVTLSPLALRQGTALLKLAPARFALALSGSAQAPVVALEGKDISAAIDAAPNAVALKAAAAALRWENGNATLTLSGGAAESAGQPMALTGIGLVAHLDKTGAVQVRDAKALVRNTDPRPAFAPIRLSQARADIKGDVLQGSGALLLNAKAQRIGSVRFAHDLGANKGSAGIEIDGLTFSPELEAYELTELARGQVENVSGTVAAHADIAWGQEISASGAIAFRNVSVATAALGPIEGINGDITLDDLFAPHSPPDQTVTIDKINPGVEVAHGVLRFQLLPGFNLRVQDARWPFAGGDLFLEPVVIDPTAPAQRMTFRAADMDAALLLEQFDLKNLRVTGRLDGTFPIIAEGTALRIENGRIATQPGGGLIQYLGEIGKEVTGPSKLAFDALQRFRYDSAALDLNGDLTGEIVAGIRFSGENQTPVSPAGGLPIKADGLPFKFNVTVRAPFRGLLNTASGLFDARKVIEQARPVDTDEIPGAAPK